MVGNKKIASVKKIVPSISWSSWYIAGSLRFRNTLYLRPEPRNVNKRKEENGSATTLVSSSRCVKINSTKQARLGGVGRELSTSEDVEQHAQKAQLTIKDNREDAVDDPQMEGRDCQQV
jgi:hypothetical protein